MAYERTKKKEIYSVTLSSGDGKRTLAPQPTGYDYVANTNNVKPGIDNIGKAPETGGSGSAAGAALIEPETNALPEAPAVGYDAKVGAYTYQNFAPSASLAYQEYTAPSGVDYTNYDPATDVAYQTALAALNAQKAQLPNYKGSYDADLASTYADITGREPFSYDLDADMLYQQYRQQYVEGGREAMMDTMGQATALTGGYGSSYAQSVGQQQYDAYLQQLNDVIPELYDRAYQQYRDEGDELLQRYSLARDLADTEYNQYRDQMSDYWTGLDAARQDEQLAYNRGLTANDTAYNRAMNANEMEYERRLNEDQINYDRMIRADDTAYNRALTQNQMEYERGLQANHDAYDRQQDEYNRLLGLMTNIGYTPSNEDLTRAGMTSSEAKAWQDYMAAQQAASYSGGGGRGSESSEYSDIANTPLGEDAQTALDYYSNVLDKKSNAYNKYMSEQDVWERLEKDKDISEAERFRIMEALEDKGYMDFYKYASTLK